MQFLMLLLQMTVRCIPSCNCLRLALLQALLLHLLRLISLISSLSIGLKADGFYKQPSKFLLIFQKVASPSALQNDYKMRGIGVGVAIKPGPGYEILGYDT